MNLPITYSQRYREDCQGFLNVYRFHGVIDPVPTYVDNVDLLYITQAIVEDDGENDTWSLITGTADIGLAIYSGERYQYLERRVRLFGPFWEGYDDDGSEKYEWDDYCVMKYNNFAIFYYLLNYNWDCIYITAIEGDDQEWIQGGDDVIFAAEVCRSDLPYGVPTPITGQCDIPGVCATIWFCRVKCNNSFCGEFWIH